MPTYQYRCNEHGHEFEVRQRMTDDPLTKCPVCGGEVRRIVSSVGIVFKGSGFYVTDNKRSNGNGGRVQTVEKSSAESKATADKPEKGDKKKEGNGESPPAKPSKQSE